MPVSFTVCGSNLLRVQSSCTVTVPVAVGMKRTWNVQEAPAASVAGQPLLSTKSPVTSMEVISSGVSAVFFSVTVCAALCVLHC